MRLPEMKYADRISKRTQVQFGGLNHSMGAADGELWDMRNLTSDHAPLLATRSARWIVKNLSQGGGLYAWEKLCWVDGKGFYYDGELKGEVTEGEKVFGCLSPYIVILPDKCYYNVDTGEFGSLESYWHSVGAVIFMDGEIYGEKASANTVYWYGAKWADYFRVGDAVTISGCTKNPGNNKTLIIRQIDGEKMYFAENSFVLDGEDGKSAYTETGDITIARTVPDIKYICEHENRLWGCSDTTVYASKWMDIFNWNAKDGIAEDSWSVDTGSAGAFTGCISFGGYPVFFKENHIYKVYGSYPSNYELLGSASLGLAAGSHGSLAIAGEVLFYLSRSGICAYTGGIPQPMGQAFGVERFSHGVAGSDGLKYYVSMCAGANDWRLYVYDTQKGMWHKEDETRATHFARMDGMLYCLNAEGEILLLGNVTDPPEGAVREENMTWIAEFADFSDMDPNKKGLSKLQLRLRLDPGASASVYIQFDSDGIWNQVGRVMDEGTKRSYYLPIIPRRTDHYRLKIEGVGGCTVHSLVRESYSGSELRAKHRRN